MQEVLSFLESTHPKSVPFQAKSFASNLKKGFTSANSSTSSGGFNSNASGNLKIPLVNGRALGVTYLGR